MKGKVNAITYLFAFLGLALLIFFHELGHFIAAKISRVRVEEFMIGLPGPKIFKFKAGETTYGITVIPFGGYVKLFGDVDTSKEDIEKNPEGSFLMKPFRLQILTIFSGPFFNLLLSVFLFAAMFIYGIPGYPSTTIEKVLKNSAAEKAGIKSGDRVVAIDNVNVKEWDDLVSYIQKNKGKKVKIKVIRNRKEKIISAVVGEKEMKGFLGVQAKRMTYRLSFFPALYRGLRHTYEMTYTFLKLLYTETVKGRLLKESAGPVGIVVETSKAVKVGVDFYLYLLGLISINLAIVNLIPIPPLDGGRIAILTYEKVTGQRLSREMMALIQLTGIILFLFLMIYLIQADIQRYHLLGANNK